MGTYRDALDKALELGGVDKDSDDYVVIDVDYARFDPTDMISQLGLY